jgi:two-component system, OmpR family, sensor histidine kinase KdpD
MSAAVFATGLCFLAYNYFFFEPRFSLYISAQQGVISVLLFLAAALIASRLAARLRAQVRALSAANSHATALQGLAQQLSSAADLEQVMSLGCAALARYLSASAWLRVGERVQQSEDAELAAIDLGAADWVQQHSQNAGRYTDTLAGANWWFLPLKSQHGSLGVVGLRFPEPTDRLVFEQQRLAEALVDDIAQAVQRVRLVKDLEAARVGEETERLRSALLSSVSHDLRSPLAAMIGSASSLANYADAMSASDQNSLLETIQIEGERLDRYIQNLLDMTRLGHNGLSIKRDWIGVDDLLASATQRLKRYQPRVQIAISLAPDLPALWVHPALIEQALFNVLENAAKFSPSEGLIQLSACQVNEQLRLDVQDQGPGIPEAERSRIFDMFFSVERGDRGREGTGLGLTIAQGMIGAHGGSINALPGPDGRGTLIRIQLPLLTPPEANAPDVD